MPPPRRILVLGGYGTFGGRIVRLLAAKRRWQIVVAGRSTAQATAFTRGLGDPAVSGVALDRESGLEAALKTLAPWLVIDASGPFQGQEARNYPVVHAALAAGAHYIDIADALDFVRGIDRFDAEAQDRNLSLISGASSVPTLSSAVVEALARDLDRLLEVEVAISSSNSATLGRSVHAALLSYAGKPIPVRRFGVTTETRALEDWRPVEMAVPGKGTLRRLVAPCAVPDLELLPERYPTLRKAMFRAGAEFSLLNRALGLMARLVSRRMLDSLQSLTGLAGLAFAMLRRFGSGRSGMVVDVTGARGGVLVARRWCLIAEEGDGLWVPALASALLADKLDQGGVPAGARIGVNLLSLEEFRAAFAGLKIADAVSDREVPPSPFRRWLGDAVDALPPAIRAIHDDPLERGASGTVTVTRGRHPVAVLMCRLLGFPESGSDRPLRVEFSPDGTCETWRRVFTGSRFVSTLRPWPDRPRYVRECIGPLAYGFEFVPAGDTLRMEFRGWWCCGVPLPRALGPKVAARQWQEGDEYCFSVEVAAPGIGPVIGYRGRLRLDPRIELREIREADVVPLAALAKRTFMAAFGASLGAEDLAAHLEETRSLAAIRESMRNDVILVAEEAGALRGYVQFGPVDMPDLADFGAAADSDRELRYLYVDPPHQNRGIGRRLLAAALAHQQMADAAWVFLDVWIRNDGARRLYERCGFTVIGERPFKTASGVAGDPDLIMVRRRPQPTPTAAREAGVAEGRY